MGWGMGAALGVSLGSGGSPAVCIVGDGSALYAPQALWSAGRLGLPVVFVVFNNRQYQILKRFLRQRDGVSAHSGRYVGVELGDPAPDFVSLAHSFGVDAVMVTGAAELAEVVRMAIERRSPFVVEVPLQSE